MEKKKETFRRSIPNPIDALQIVVPRVRVPVMRQMPYRALGPLERFYFGVVDGVQRAGERGETVGVGRRQFQIDESRQRPVRVVRPVVGLGGSWQFVHDDRRPAVLRSRRKVGRPASVGRDQLFRERLIGQPAEHGRRLDAQQVAAADQRHFGAAHQYLQRQPVGHRVPSAEQHRRHRGHRISVSLVWRLVRVVVVADVNDLL